MSNPCAGFKARSGALFDMGGEVVGEDLAILKLTRIDSNITNMKPAFQDIVGEYRKDVEKQFQSEGRHFGFPWAQLKDSTISQRIRQGYPGEHPILKRSGDLKDSLTRASDPNACQVVTRQQWFIGTQIPYAAFHQSRAPRYRLPRRAFLAISKTFRLFSVRKMHKWAVTGKL